MPGRTCRCICATIGRRSCISLGVEVIPYARLFGADVTLPISCTCVSSEPIVCEHVDTVVLALGHEPETALGIRAPGHGSAGSRSPATASRPARPRKPSMRGCWPGVWYRQLETLLPIPSGSAVAAPKETPLSSFAGGSIAHCPPAKMLTILSQNVSGMMVLFLNPVRCVGHPRPAPRCRCWRAGASPDRAKGQTTGGLFIFLINLQRTGSASTFSLRRSFALSYPPELSHLRRHGKARPPPSTD